MKQDGLVMEPAKKRCETAEELAEMVTRMSQSALRCPAVQPAWHMLRACVGAALDFDSRVLNPWALRPLAESHTAAMHKAACKILHLDVNDTYTREWLFTDVEAAGAGLP